MTERTPYPAYSYEWFIDRFETAKSRAIAFSEPIDPDLFLTRPPGSDTTWSVGECYDHLNNFGSIYLDRIREGIADAPAEAKGGNDPFPPRLLWKGVIRLFAPPYKMKLKTVGPFHPGLQADLDKETVLEEYLGLQDRMIHQLNHARSEGLDLSAHKVSNPLIGFVRMTLAECFAVVEVHQRRHQWQAQQVYEHLQGNRVS